MMTKRARATKKGKAAIDAYINAAIAFKNLSDKGQQKVGLELLEYALAQYRLHKIELEGVWPSLQELEKLAEDAKHDNNPFNRDYEPTV